MKLLLESALDTFDLDSAMQTGRGVQVLAGLTGLGLPPVSVQWLEGAGDGATFRGQRVLPRDIDLPLWFEAANRHRLQDLLSRFSRICAGEATLRLIEDDGESWSTKVHRVGGGTYTYGVDTLGSRTFETVVTMRAGDPFWTADRTQSQVIKPSTGANFATQLSSLALAPGQTIGEILLDNDGDARTYPVWTITGPGQNFRAVSPTGEEFEWTGTLAAGESLTVDTRTGKVIDGTGANRYASMAPAPRMWSVPPGLTTATASLDNTVAGSSIKCEWRARKWMVV